MIYALWPTRNSAMVHRLKTTGIGAYVRLPFNATDVGPNLILRKDSRDLWLNRPEFLKQPKKLPTAQDTEFVPARKADLLNTLNSTEVLRGDLEELIESALFLYALKKDSTNQTADVRLATFTYCSL